MRRYYRTRMNPGNPGNPQIIPRYTPGNLPLAPIPQSQNLTFYTPQLDIIEKQNLEKLYRDCHLDNSRSIDTLKEGLRRYLTKLLEGLKDTARENRMLSDLKGNSFYRPVARETQDVGQCLI